MDIKEIYELAQKAGACEDKGLSLIEKCSSIDDLIDLMLTPQGIEFCMVNSFPSIDVLMHFEEQLIGKSIFIAGSHKINARGKILVFGGDITINASGYNVVDIYATNGAAIKVIATENSYV